MMNPRRSSRRRGTLAALLVVFVATGSLIAYLNRDRIEERVVEPAPVATQIPAPAELTADERALYDFVAPRLAVLIGEGAELEKLGRERSRNLVQLQVRSERVAKLADDIDSYLEAHPTSARLSPVVARYQLAIDDVRTGMNDSRAAVFRFDWDAVALGLDQFSAGIAALGGVLAELSSAAGGPATPVVAV